MTSPNDVDSKIAALDDLPREQLVAFWRKTYGVDPPAGVRRELLARAQAWQIQEKQYGGLSTEAKRLLKAAMRQAVKKLNLADESSSVVSSGSTTSPTDASSKRTVLPGARLVRDWNGRTYVVDAVEAGFLLEGKRYRSLSGIAKQITGATWSGPRFFGL